MHRHAIYQYNDYKTYVLDWIARSPQGGRGLRKKLADAVGCQTPFITHVLAGDYHFSPEQAEACATWLGLADLEAEYFVLLVLKARASTRSLSSLLNKQIIERREHAAVLKKRLQIDATLSPEVQTIYCSSWHYSAAHMALQIPELRSLEALRKYFSWSLNRTREVVDFLTEHGLIASGKSGLKVLKPVLHFDKNSPLLNQYLSHWRLKAIESHQYKVAADLHYSGVISLSLEDFQWARETLSQALSEIIARVKDSRDEKLAVLNIDWFGL